MNIFKTLIRKLIYKEDASSETLKTYLKRYGAQIGENVTIYAPNKTLIDKTAPWLLKFGNYVRITEGVKILTHDYSWSVLKRYQSDNVISGQIIGAQSPVEIGDNVFIGMNSVITRGVSIGDNVIIGAGSVVTKDCQSNSVYAGVPAKRIMSIEDFYNKRKDAQFKEAKNIALWYKKSFGVIPPKEIFSEYCMLFSSKEEIEQTTAFKAQAMTSGNYDASIKYLENSERMFESFEEFLTACYDRSNQ